MANSRIKPEQPRVSSDPNRPAYDNPVGNKGELAAGNNVLPTPPRTPAMQPQGHESDKKLGRKPSR
jgi:hypothetical protein